MSAEHENRGINIADMPGGKLSEALSTIREDYARIKELQNKFAWDNITSINKLEPQDKKQLSALNTDAQIGELIFEQEFILAGKSELTFELHQGMEETIEVPNGSSDLNVEITLVTPLTRREQRINLTQPGDKVMIPPHTIHRTRNLQHKKITLIAKGVKTSEDGWTIKNPETKDIFQPEQVAICMAAKYQDWTPGNTDLANETRTRGYLALGLVRESERHGYNIVVADGGSSKQFLDNLAKFSNVTMVEGKDISTFGRQKRAAIQTGADLEGVRYILRIEPEKVDTVVHLPTLVESILQSQADVVIGKRSDQQFRQSYPDYGYTIEQQTNSLMNRQLRQNGLLEDQDPDLDLYSGIIVFRNSPEVVDLFTRRFKYVGNEKLDPMTLEGWMHAQVYGAILALHQGLKVKQVEVPFWYAGLQKSNETHPTKIEKFVEKRIMQQGIGERGVQLLAETLSGKQTHLVIE